MSFDYTYDYNEKPYVPPKLKTNRKMWKLIVFTFLTFGIYAIVFFTPFSYDLDTIDPKRERGKTMNFLVAFILSLFTFSFVLFFWHHHIAERVNEALKRRKIDYNFGTTDFWAWLVFGSFILVGPFIYYHKLCTAMNLLCENYNETIALEK